MRRRFTLSLLSLAVAVAVVVIVSRPTVARAQYTAPPADDLPGLLSLDEAVSIARAHQPQLRQAHAATQVAEARSDQRRAPLLPQVNLNASYTRSRIDGVAASTGATPGTTVTAFPSLLSTGLVANQLIYDFGQSTSNWRSFQASEESQRQTEAATILQVVLNVRSAYLNARANKSLVAVANETLANQDRHLAQVNAFVEVGTRPRIDLAQARSDQATAQLQLIKANASYGIARAQLRQAMGINGNADFEVTDEQLGPVPGEDSTSEQLLDQALAARPEFRALQAQVLAQELTLRAIRGTFGPALGVTASGGYRRPELETAAGATLILSAGLTLSWALVEGGLERARLREGEANLINLRAGGDVTRQQVAVEVEQARLAVTSSKGAIVAARSALENARERLRLAEARYQTGVGNAIELGDAQLAVTNAGVQLLQAEFQLGTARAQLLKALGR